MTAENHKPRLKRLERIFARIPIYFLTACTDRRRKLLAKASVHKSFISFAKQGVDRGAWVGAYVLMPDHFHVFVGFDERETEVSDWMKSLKNTLSKTLRQDGIPSPHWQKGFFDHVLRSDESYEEKWHYVRENPVRAGLAQSWREWPYAGEICELRFD